MNNDKYKNKKTIIYWSGFSGRTLSLISTILTVEFIHVVVEVVRDAVKEVGAALVALRVASAANAHVAKLLVCVVLVRHSGVEQEAELFRYLLHGHIALEAFGHLEGVSQFNYVGFAGIPCHVDGGVNISGRNHIHVHRFVAHLFEMR